MKTSFTFRDWLREALFPVAAVMVALLVGVGLIVLAGKNPLTAYQALWGGAFSNPGALTGTLTKATPLMLTGLAVAFGFRCGLFNIGGEGQLLVGALAAALAGTYLAGWPRLIHLTLAVGAGIVAGGAWAIVPAVLKVKRGVHEVISTIMMNWIAVYMVHYLVVVPFKAPGEMPATRPIAETAKLGLLVGPPNRLSAGILLALACVVIVYILLNRTSVGYEIRAVGLNPHAAEYAGIDAGRNAILALVVSGALAGLAGVTEILGTFHRFYDGFSPGYGFDGIPVALLARNNPWGIVLTALLFGALRNGSITMQVEAGVSKEIVYAVQGMIIIFIAGENMLRWALGARKEAAAR